MERDPLRFAWRAAPAAHVLAFAVLLLGRLPLALVGLDLVRGPSTTRSMAWPSAAAPCRRLRCGSRSPCRTVPRRARPRPLFPGVPLDRAATFAPRPPSALAAGRSSPRSSSPRPAGHRRRGSRRARWRGLRRAILDGARRRPRRRPRRGAQRRGARRRGLARDSAVLGWAVLTPLHAGGAIALALLYALALDWRLAAASPFSSIVCAAFACAGSSARGAGGRRPQARGASARRRRSTTSSPTCRRRAARPGGPRAPPARRERIGAGSRRSTAPLERPARRSPGRRSLAAAPRAAPLGASGSAPGSPCRTPTDHRRRGRGRRRRRAPRGRGARAPRRAGSSDLAAGAAALRGDRAHARRLARPRSGAAPARRRCPPPGALVARKASRPTIAASGARISRRRPLDRASRPMSPCRRRRCRRRASSPRLVGGQLEPSTRPSSPMAASICSRPSRPSGRAASPSPAASTILLAGLAAAEPALRLPRRPTRPRSSGASPRPRPRSGSTASIHARGLAGTVDPARRAEARRGARRGEACRARGARRSGSPTT